MKLVTSNNYHQVIGSLDFSSLKNKSVFITGGTGFFGIWLINLFRILNNSGSQISVCLLSRDPQKMITNYPEINEYEWISWVKGDVTNYEAPDTAFDFFIHGAADTSPEALNTPSLTFQNIVSGTKHVMEHAIKCGVKRVLMISSGAVYGETPAGLDFITEDTNTSPLTNIIDNVYGEGKRAAEMLSFCMAYEYYIDLIVARCFAFTGQGIGEHLVLGQLIKQAQNANEIVINGSGKARRSFLHGQDLSIWLLKILTDGKSGEIYNVGSDEAFTIKELAELVGKIIAPQKEIIVLGTQKKEYRLNYIPSVVKAKNLGLKVWVTLNEAINLKVKQ